MSPPNRQREAGPERRARWPRPFRLLVAGQAAGQAGDALAQVTFAQFVLFEVGRGATPAEITGLLAATLLPFSVVGPFAGVVIDRVDRRRVLVGLSLVRIALVGAALGALLTESRWVGYVGIVLLLSASRFVLAGKGAALPRTVAPEQLVTANSRAVVVGMVASFTAGVLATLVVVVVPAAGFVTAGGCYLVSVVAFHRLPPVGGGDAGVGVLHGVRAVAAELLDGLRVVVGQAAIRRPLVSVWVHRFLVGGGVLVLVLVADSRYSLEAPGYGLALLVSGVGAFLGTISVPTLARYLQPDGIRVAAFWLAAVAAAVAAASPDLAVLVGAVGVASFGFQVLKVRVDAEVGLAAADRVRGRVFAVYDVLYNVSFVLAGLLLVGVWAPGRVQALLWGLGAAFVVGGLWYLPGALARTAGSRVAEGPRGLSAGRPSGGGSRA